MVEVTTLHLTNLNTLRKMLPNNLYVAIVMEVVDGMTHMEGYYIVQFVMEQELQSHSIHDKPTMLSVLVIVIVNCIIEQVHQVLSVKFVGVQY